MSTPWRAAVPHPAPRFLWICGPGDDDDDDDETPIGDPDDDDDFDADEEEEEDDTLWTCMTHASLR